MQRLTPRMFVFHKRVWPLAMLGLVLLLIVPSIAAGKFPPSPFIFLLMIFIAFGAYGTAVTTWDLLDEVWDAGDALIVHKKRQEDRIALASVMSVDYLWLANPPTRVILKLRAPGIFGDTISFCRPWRFMLIKDRQIDDLIRRVDAARTRPR